MDLSVVNQYLFPAQIPHWLFALKIFLILFNLGVIAFIVYVWLTTIYLKRLFFWDLKEFMTMRAYHVRRIDQDWNAIKKRLLRDQESEYKLAIIEADLLVNDTLGRMGFAGANLGEKLDAASPDRFTDITSLKEADQAYRNIVEDPSFAVNYDYAKRIVLAFEQGLKDVQAFTEK